jgi:hypothetical protein
MGTEAGLLDGDFALKSGNISKACITSKFSMKYSPVATNGEMRTVIIPSTLVTSRVEIFVGETVPEIGTESITIKKRADATDIATT